MHCRSSKQRVRKTTNDGKEDWKQRKARYRDRLQSIVDASMYLVSAADELHNLRSMRADYERLGEPPASARSAGSPFYYAIHECWYEDGAPPNSIPNSWTAEAIEPLGHRLDELRWNLERMLDSLKMPVLEIDSERLVETTL